MPPQRAPTKVDDNKRMITSLDPGVGDNKLKILTLPEASFLSQQSEEALLREGELGALIFFIRAPAGATVRLYNERTAESAEPPLMRIPNVFALDKQACRDLVTWRRTQIDRTTQAALLNQSSYGDEFRHLDLADFEHRSPRVEDSRHYPLARWTHWMIRAPGGIPVDIDISEVRVFELNIKTRFDLVPEPRRPVTAPGESGDRGNYKSSLLQHAIRAAELFWGPRVQEGEPSTYPDTAVVIRWLQNQDPSLSLSLAKNIASVIRPDFAPKVRVSREPPEDRDPPRKRAGAKHGPA